MTVNKLTGANSSTVTAAASAITWATLTGKPATFPPSAHTHAQSEVTGLVTALGLKADATALAAKVDSTDSRLSDARTPLAHSQAASTISDSSAPGRALLTAANVAAQRTALGLGLPVANGSAADQATVAGTDTYVTGSALAIGGRIQAGTTLYWTVKFSKSAAGVAAWTVNVRIGTLGTVVDTARLSFAMAAQTAVADDGWLDVAVNIRSVNATTGAVAGSVQFNHRLTTTGLATAAQPQIPARVVSANFDTTVAGLIAGLSINPGASGVFTFEVVQASAQNLV